MFGVERRSRIISLLNDKKSVLVQEIAPIFAVTEETIRRDLKALEKQGVLIRTHGGAVIADDIKTEAPLVIREGINISGKNAIGRYAANLVNNGDTIILDASTSSLYVAKHIKDKQNLTVITNAQRVIVELSECTNITLISTGGTLRNKSLSYVGTSAENALKTYYANKVFFSCKGFSPKIGLTDSNEQESDMRKLMLQCSQQAIFLCDHTKFNKVGYVTTASLSDIDMIITDQSLPQSWDNEMQDSNVTIEISK